MENEIHLYGTVGADFWDEDYFTASDVRDALSGLSGSITVRINSGGGVASEGQAIYTMLVDYPGEVNVIVDGTAASAASLIAMAGDTITMRLGATMMIHDPADGGWVEGRGTEADHLDAAASLRVVSNAYAAVYAARAGMSVEDAREIMRAETYYDGPAAVAAGFATDFDQETPAQAVARFDYRVYAHAPKELQQAGGRFSARTSRMAVMAMMAGSAAPHSKETDMENEDTGDQREDIADEEEDQESADASDDVEDDEEIAADDEDVDGADGGDDEVNASTVAVQIMDLCMASNRPEGEARDLIARGLSLSQAVAEITAKRAKENPVNGNKKGVSRAKIMRDERSTRRIGMAQAITAQIMNAEPASSQAHGFMNMSLVEMAAKCIGHNGPMRNSGQRAQVFMDASHSTSDFPHIFENALNKVLLERYEGAEPTFRKISRKRNFADFRVHPMVRSGDFPKLKPVGENGDIKFGTFGESRETAVLSPYAIGLKISRQMMVNDELGAIDDLLSDYGSMVADFEEETFFAFALSAELSDTKAIFHTDHGNVAASGSAISVASVSAGRAAMRKQTSLDGKKLNLAPSILLVGPNKETEAEQLVAAIQPQESGKVNPFSGRLEVVTTAQITNNNWYLLAGSDRPGGACWVHGYLDGAEAPRVRTEEAFGQQGMAMSVEHDFGTGAVDFRGGYKNAGA